jgi:tripartite ATP-independent transporter DctP family solute receptor
MDRRSTLIGLATLAGLALSSTTGLAQEVRLRAGHDQPVGSMYDEGHQMFRKLLDERSKGRIKVEVFPAAQLGSEVAMIEGVRLGSVDVSAAHVANASTVVPELALFSVSYLFKDRDHYERVINDPKFRERIESLVASKNLGIRVIGYYAAGVRNVYTRRGPAATPDDLKGTKIRVMNNPVEAKIWNTLGAIPTPMNFGEVYQSLQSGVLDAAENAPAVIESNRHYEAAKTIILTEHQRSISLLVMNERKFNGLSSDLKEITLAAAREAAEHERKKDAEFNAQAVDRMKEKGAQIVTPDRAKFADRIAPIQDEVAANLKMTDVLQLIRSHAK